MPKTAALLEEIAALKAMLIAADARDKRKDERIARLEKLVAAFKQAIFGRKSEKSDPDQFELALEDLETAMAVIHAEEDAENWAVIASLIETCKMNGVDPHACLSATLTAVVKGHKQSQIDGLLPWNYAVTV